MVYSSKTGNTAMLAKEIERCLAEETCTYSGAPQAGAADGVELVFAGFWTDKGDCPPEMAEFLQSLRGKRLFLFGTAGFGGAPEYFEQILARVRRHVDASNTVVGAYLCQGKMPDSVRQRYEALQQTEPDKARPMLENFERALSHPDATDLQGLREQVEQTCNLNCCGG